MGYRGNIELPMYKELEKGQRITEGRDRRNL